MKCHEAIHALMKWYPLSLDDLDGEIWRDIDGFDGYQISNFGRVKSFMRKQPRILKPQPFHLSGYLCVHIYKGKDRCYLSIHSLVAKTFIQNPEGKPMVNHIDGCKLNSHVSNLEWVTASENQQHAYDIGLAANGEERTDTKLTNEQVAYARTVYKPYDKEFGAAALARKFGVTRDIVKCAVHGKTYKRVIGEMHKSRQQRVPDEIRNEIRRLYKKGVRGCGAPALANKFGIGHTTVSVIVNETKN